MLTLPRTHFGIDLFLWNGTTYHLWFLPFIFLASTLSFAIGKWTLSSHKSYWLVAGFCVLLALVLAFNHQPDTFKRWGYTWQLTANTLPSVLLAIALSMAYVRIGADFFDRQSVTIVSGLLWLATLLLPIWLERSIPLETFSGLTLMVASLNRINLPGLSRFASWGKWSFGIYIVHILFLEGFHIIAYGLGMVPSWQSDIWTFFVTLACCILTIFLMNKNERTRNMLL